MIVAAAVKTSDGRIWSVPRPGRHHNVFGAITKGIGYDIKADEGSLDTPERKRWIAYMKDHEQGFVTNSGAFLDRDQSLAHAKQCGQLMVKGALVQHEVLGRGRVLHVQLSGNLVLGRLRVHVKFDKSTDENMWVADDELERALLGSILTSEDLW